MSFSVTNSEGRCSDLLPPHHSDAAKQEKTDPVTGSRYKMIFKTKEYFDRTNRKTFYPCVEVV
jgi:5-hydroxyisourate hydrolase